MGYDWTVELITDEVVCNTIEFTAKEIVLESQTVAYVDGIRWEIPAQIMSFGRVARQKIDTHA